MPYANRFPHRPLPSIDSLPFPASAIAVCEDCHLRLGCTRPVPGENVNPVKVVLVGQNPGVVEDREGRPFIGPAGQYLDSLLFQCGVSREAVAVLNLVCCLTPNNRIPTAIEIAACRHWLDLELSIIQPEIIVAMGGPAISHFLGAGAGTVEHLHGKPQQLPNGRIILPSYHPASALHDTAKLRQCHDDFQVLRGLVKGVDWRSYNVVDAFPDPDYRVADTPEALAEMKRDIESSGVFAVDTEICRGRLWSVQVSARPGTAWFIPIPECVDRYDLTQFDATAIVHNYLFDVNYLDIDRFVDTMVIAYLAGQPQGLKELASRLCGIRMINYSEMVRPGQERISLDYLNRIKNTDWGDPPTIEETRWDNKKGAIVTKIKKPWRISRKIKKLLDDFAENPNTDLWDRWRSIPEAERAVVESVAGPMPESSLMDIPFDDAKNYACRDADATLRVYYKLRELVDRIGLDYVLDMDLGILPMVDSMMRNGMPVDLDHYRKLSEEYDIRLRVEAASLAGIVGHPFNPNSSPQVAAVVYKELGFKPTKYTESGEISTDDAELKKTKHPVAKGIIKYRGILKLKTTYADNIIRSAHPDANGVPRMHTVLKTTRVETGRLSSSKDDNGEGANLQNIPTRNKESKQIKNGFVASPGMVMLEGDLGQIEIRTQTHLANCRGLIELLLSGKDPHTTTASKLFGIPYEEAKQNKYRYPCKRAGFGIIYMIGAHGLSTQINEYIADLEMDGEPVDIEPWDEPTCQKFIDDYYKLYPEIRDYQMEKLAEARRNGYVADMFGRIRYIPEVTCPITSIAEAGARQAANFPVTASAQGVIKKAMIEIWKQLPEWSGTESLMQIHDSLVFQLPEDPDYVKRFAQMAKRAMCETVQLLVPIDADFKVGKRWGELQKVEL